MVVYNDQHSLFSFQIIPPVVVTSEGGTHLNSIYSTENGPKKDPEKPLKVSQLLATSIYSSIWCNKYAVFHYIIINVQTDVRINSRIKYTIKVFNILKVSRT